MMDLRKMYKGKGAALFSHEDRDRFLSSISGAIGATVAIGGPPSYEYPPGNPPEYDVEEQSSLLPPSQQSIASESDDSTIAAPTPLGYRRNGEGHRFEELCDSKGLHAH